MRIENSQPRLWLPAITMFVLSLVVMFADRMEMLSGTRSALHDVFSPGRLAVIAMQATSESGGNANEATVYSASVAVDANNAQQMKALRQLMIENARLRRDLKRSQTASVIAEAIDPSESLNEYAMIPAKVISNNGLPGSLRELIISAGKSAGINRSELVVDGIGAVVDVGSDAGVAAGDRVLSGSSVVGRIEKTGRWVSVVQPLTSTDFRAQVQLLRSSEDGIVFGAIGMLEGTGESECRVTGIPYIEAVTVGDTVISADINGVRGPRLFFGTVTSAEFLAGGQWEVRIKPGFTIAELDQVGIVRMSLRPDVMTMTNSKPIP